MIRCTSSGALCALSAYIFWLGTATGQPAEIPAGWQPVELGRFPPTIEEEVEPGTFVTRPLFRDVWAATPEGLIISFGRSADGAFRDVPVLYNVSLSELTVLDPTPGAWALPNTAGQVVVSSLAETQVYLHDVASGERTRVHDTICIWKAGLMRVGGGNDHGGPVVWLKSGRLPKQGSELWSISG